MNCAKKTEKRFDAALNCLLSMALQTMGKLAAILGYADRFSYRAEDINAEINKRFFDEEKGVYFNSTIDSGSSILVNALAILCGAAAGKQAHLLAEQLVSGTVLTRDTLSMRCFMYDALLLTDKEKYKAFVLNDIDAVYGKMLDAGATSFWETEKGQEDFYYAGSLCHGWSAMPVYYYHTLL